MIAFRKKVIREYLLRADCVDLVAFGSRGFAPLFRGQVMLSDCFVRIRRSPLLATLAWPASEVLGCGFEVELVTRAVRPAQSQSTELQDAFEVGEQHLD
jgi:hypothetical protein